ncbi:MAG: hypothetical protein U0841_29425 [Chloroflexia bacterium]
MRALLGARKPVIWSGMGTTPPGRRSCANSPRTTQIPVYCTMPGKSGFDETAPPGARLRQRHDDAPRLPLASKSDVLFAVGSNLTRTSYGQPIPDGKTIIHNTESIEDISKDYSRPPSACPATKLALHAILDEVKGQIGEQPRQNDVAAQISDLRQQWLAEWTPFLTADDTPIQTYRVVGEDSSGRSARAHHHSPTTCGAPRDVAMPFYRASVPHNCIGKTTTSASASADDRREAGPAGRILPQFHGRQCLRHAPRPRYRDLRAHRRADHPTIVLSNGDMAAY